MDNLYIGNKIEELKETGGARIGMVNATWPFATLLVNRNELKLNASIIGSFSFNPSDIIAIEPYTIIPLLGQGIRIYHRVENYNPKIIFWTFGSPEALIARIRQTGFLSNTDIISTDIKQEILAAQLKGGFPIKTSAGITLVVIWNILFLSDFYKFITGKATGSPLGIGAQLALGFAFFTCIGMLLSEPFRQLILKEGWALNERRMFLYFLMFISGIMLIVISFVPK